MITPEWCRMMARYNAWQNKGLRKVIEGMDPEEARKDRGAFFGSIFATANHLLWGDLLWMSRLDGSEAPEGGIAESVDLCQTRGDWEALRYRTDGRIREWADRLVGVNLVGDLTFTSRMLGREVSKPIGLCISHFFNHQTHHRGQVHAMLTSAGYELPDTDLFLLEGT